MIAHRCRLFVRNPWWGLWHHNGHHAPCSLALLPHLVEELRTVCGIADLAYGQHVLHEQRQRGLHRHAHIIGLCQLSIASLCVCPHAYGVQSLDASWWNGQD